MSIFTRALKRSQRALATLVDETVTSTLLAPRPARDPQQEERRAERLLAYIYAMEDLAQQLGAHDHFIDNPGAFFEAPGPIYAQPETLRSLGNGVEVSQLRWRSKYEPFCQDIARRYLDQSLNRYAVARIWQKERARRPVVICLHGYMGGHLGVEEKLWPIDKMLARGWDVVLPVLPHHGPRGVRRPKERPFFPSPDLRITVESLRQAIFDVRALLEILRRDGERPVAVMGMSLGGYVTSLLGTLQADLAAIVPIIPLSSFAAWYDERDALIGDPGQRRRHLEAIEEVTQVVAPLRRPLLLEPQRCMIVAGVADRVTPIGHAEKLASHFRASLRTFHGGHLLQLGRAEAFEEAFAMIEQAFEQAW